MDNIFLLLQHANVSLDAGHWQNFSVKSVIFLFLFLFFSLSFIKLLSFVLPDSFICLLICLINPFVSSVRWSRVDYFLWGKFSLQVSLLKALDVQWHSSIRFDKFDPTLWELLVFNVQIPGSSSFPSSCSRLSL